MIKYEAIARERIRAARASMSALVNALRTTNRSTDKQFEAETVSDFHQFASAPPTPRRREG